MSGGFPLGQLVMGRCVSNQEDGDGSQADVSYQVLVVARLSPNLKKKREKVINEKKCRRVPKSLHRKPSGR